MPNRSMASMCSVGAPSPELGEAVGLRVAGGLSGFPTGLGNEVGVEVDVAVRHVCHHMSSEYSLQQIL